MENKANEENVEQQEQIPSSKKKIPILMILKISWNIIEKILMVLIIFISIVIITQKVSNNEDAFLGYRLFRVQTGSMIPEYNIGDVILVKEKQLDKIKVGDDVTYDGKEGTMVGKLVTHRVIDIEMIDGQKAFHTKGIANNLEDPIVYGGQINGVVQCKLYSLTLITNALANKYIFYFGGIIPLTLFIFFSFVRGTNRKFEQ